MGLWCVALLALHILRFGKIYSPGSSRVQLRTQRFLDRQCAVVAGSAQWCVILSLKMKGDVISDQSLMLWFQKDSLDIVGFGTFRVGSGFPKLLRLIFPLCES